MAISPQNNEKTVFYTGKLYGLTGMQEQGQIGNMMHVAVVREVVQAVVQLLHILSMVSLPSTQPQQHSCQPLLGVNLSPEFVNLYFPYAGRGLLSFRW